MAHRKLRIGRDWQFPAHARFYLCLLGFFLSAACAQTTVRPIVRTADKNLPRPARILIYDFAITDININEYQGILRQQPSNKNARERQREIGWLASEALTANLAQALRPLGFAVERVTRDTIVKETDLSIDGRIVSVDEGSPLRRLLIGLGSGASTMTARVQVFRPSQRQMLLEFTIHADSGRMPGAAATVPVSAAVPFGVGLGMSTGGAVATGLNANGSTVGHMAASSADQAVRFLSEFFARQGWIAENQVKGARIAY